MHTHKDETTLLDTPLTRDAGIDVPVICGAMYPCSNPELVAAVSRAGGLGVIQPISMEFVHKRPLKEGIQYMQTLTDKPFGFNAIVEKSSVKYEQRMKTWVDIALDSGIRFFITALGNPAWVVKKVHARGGKVYHDVTGVQWAQKALDAGVDGFICVNANAGGHAGQMDPEQLHRQVSSLDKPVVCAGGISSPGQFKEILQMGYAGVQMGTRFIATKECTAHGDYKQAILTAGKADIVLTDKISGVPVSVIKTPYIEKTGTRAGWLPRKLLRHPKGKHYMRMLYTLKSVWQLRDASMKGSSYKDFFQAGKSVEHIDEIMEAGQVVESFARILKP